MDTRNAERRGGSPIACWLWAGIATVVCAAVIPLEPSLLEEGLIVHFAQRLVRGEHLYRDLIFFSGPFPFELLALLFRVFGEEVAVGRVAVALLAGAAAGAACAIARRSGAGAAAHAVAASLAFAPPLLFPLLSTYFYSTLALHLGVLAAYASLRAVDSMRWAVIAGGLVACVALTKQSVGVALALALVGALFWNGSGGRVRHVLAMVAGGAIVALITILLFAARGDLGALVHSMVAMPLELGESFSSGYVNLWPLGEFDSDTRANQAFYVPHLYNILSDRPSVRGGAVGAPLIALTQFLFALPAFAVVLTLVRRAAIGPLAGAVWFGEALLLAMIANLFPRADWGHLVFVLPVAAAQVWLSVGSSRGRLLIWASWGWVAALGLGAGLATGELHRAAGPSNLGPRIPQLPVSRAYRDPGVARAAEFLRAHSEPGESVFVARAEPLLYFATDTRNPTPYGGVLPGLREQQEQTIIAALRDVRYVVMSEIDQPLFLYYRDELPAVQSYLERYFRVPREYRSAPSWIIVLERAADRGPTEIDLFDLQSTARRWTRGSDGARRKNVAPPPKLASRLNRRPVAIALGPRGGGLDFPIEVPDRAVFRADIGYPMLAGAVEHHHARGVRLEVLIADASSPGRFRTLMSEPATPGQASWRPIALDLSEYSGRSITLRLQAVPAQMLPPGSLAWWGSPNISVKRR